jgi:cytochrome P450
MERFALRDEFGTKFYDERPTDLLGKLLLLKKEKSILKDNWVRNIALTNFGAGVETTAITVSAFIVNIVSHPGCQERIHREIDVAKKAGKLSNPPKLREMKDHLPYLSACLNESMRLHPVVGMPLVRIVPEGQVLEGHYLSAGTTVGINPWVFARDKSLYGDDAEEWRPERWLEYSPGQLKHLGMSLYSYRRIQLIST